MSKKLRTTKKATMGRPRKGLSLRTERWTAYLTPDESTALYQDQSGGRPWRGATKCEIIRSYLPASVIEASK